MTHEPFDPRYDPDGDLNDEDHAGLAEFLTDHPPFEASINIPTLSVNVDVNDLIETYGKEEAYKMLGDLKDLFS